MKKLTNIFFALGIILALILGIFNTLGGYSASAQEESGWELIGTYNVNYRNNAAGAPPTYNPWYANYIPPGPYFLDPALTPPGHYKAVVTGWNGDYYGNACIWDGDSQGGTRYPIDNYVGYTEEFDHTDGQIVIYAVDWYPWDNPDFCWSTVELWRELNEPEPPSGMVSYWRFDEGNGTTAYDSVGTNDGALINSPTWTIGKVGDALSFDGVNDYVKVPHTASLDFVNQITMEAWIKPNSYSVYSKIMQREGGNTYSLSIPNGQLWFYLIAGFGSSGTIYNLVSDYSIPTGVWSHVVATYDSSSMKLYVNGVMIKERSATGLIKTYTGDLTIGNTGFGGSNWAFNGLIDETALYSTALTLEQIRQHYENGLTGIDYFSETTVDTTAPTTTISLNPSGTNNWYNGQVFASLSASDNTDGSGVRELHYILDSGNETTITGETTNLQINTDGYHTLEAWAIDNNGNVGVQHATSDFKIDQTTPIVTGASTTSPNINDWYNSDVTVHFVASDGLSGITVAPSDVIVYSEGSGQAATQTVSDLAGNTVSVTVNNINIDKTPPVIAISLPETANINQAVNASWTATDVLSGVEGATSGTIHINTSTTGTKTITVTVMDKAGNPASQTRSIMVNSPTSIASNFNGNAIANGSYIWFNSVLKLKAPTSPTNTFIVHFTSQTISFTASGNSYTINVPDADVIFDPAATDATTIFDYNASKWVTTVPSTYTGNVFLSGIVFQSPGLPGGINPVTWNGAFSASGPFEIQWKWAAAVYNLPNGTPENNELGVKPVDSNTLCITYQNSDHAGTMENYKDYVIGGARGGGGSNYTGGYSGTAAVSG